MSRSARLVAAASAGLAVLVSTLVVAAPVQASRAVTENYAVPKGGRLSLTGHGYGHGHGMSQYGAQGAALKGLTYAQIVAFYYPGTALTSTSGAMRVLLSADTDNQVQVSPASGLSVREVSTGTTWALPRYAGITTWRLRNTVSGATALDYYDGTWHVLHPGGRIINGDGEFFRTGNAFPTLQLGTARRVYRGALRLTNTNTVNVVSVDDYVRGVIPREMPASWQPEALRAQAVAARTYGVFDRTAHPTRYYDTCDTTSCQVYGGRSDEDARSNAAVTATANKILSYGGKPAFTQFSSSSGGWLSAGSQPYLVAKSDPYDAVSSNANHTWKTTLTRAQIQRAYPSLGTLRRVLIRQRDGHGAWYGRVERMVLDGSKKDVTLTGDAFRSKFGLKSSWFHFP
jgi:SpoIID/LytB domain protein